MNRRRTAIYPAFFASALIHGGLLVATILAWPWLSKDMQIGKVVPVTLVTMGPGAELAPAVKAPEPSPATAPAPTPEAPPQPAPISPAPPTPAAPSAAKSAAQAKPNQAKPTPSLKAKPSSAKANADQGLDLDSLMASIQSSTKNASTKATSGLQGANRPKTAVTASDSHGSDNTMSASELSGLNDKFRKLWNPNCGVVGASGDIIRVHVVLTPQGWLAKDPDLPDRARIYGSGNQMEIVSAQRALSAVGRGQPYTDVLSPEHYSLWRDMILKFDPKDLCGH